MPMMTVTRNGQVTIPKEFRDALGIEEGTKLIMKKQGNNIVLSKFDIEFLRNRESVLPENYWEFVQTMRRQDEKRWNRLIKEMKK